MAGAAVIWRSKKQEVTAPSTMLAEYYSLFEACKAVVWLRDLLEELGHPVEGPVCVFADNQGANSMANDIKLTEQNKHCRLRYHYVRECVETGDVSIRYVGTNENAADLLTKLVPKVKTQDCAKMMGLSGV